MRETLFIPKWMIILSVCDGRNMSFIAKEAKVTYSHIGKVIKRLEHDNFVKSVFKGRSRTVYLLPKAKHVKNLCDQMIEGVK